MEEEIIEFLNKRNYDIRKSNNARWIDQKCTIDVLSVVADCILEYIGDNEDKEFTVKDIWFYEYTVLNVQDIFRKPNPKKQAKNEYDKWFGQPIKLFAYSQIITEKTKNKRHTYKVNNKKILEYISVRDRNAMIFLNLYIGKVLLDSELLPYFNVFFEKQNKEAYKELRKKFIEFTIYNTPINGKVECGRIFAKILNPLAFTKNKKGTVKGRISKNIITNDQLLYNRVNWRDTKKPKDVTREVYEMQNLSTLDKMTEYKIQKAKKLLRKYNEKYRNGKSEVDDNGEYLSNAIHIHHIFPKADFMEIADKLENLIALTPTQHMVNAHDNGNTTYINKEYQHLCLIHKVSNIKENLESPEREHIYEFDEMIHVLNEGLDTTDFSKIETMDFNSVLKIIDEKYINE